MFKGNRRMAPSQTQADTVAIVVNWNRRELTLRCLESLRATQYTPLDILVVDNASSDGSVAAIRAQFPGVTIIENDENLGFADGNNGGLRWALEREYRFMLLLNNDAVASPELVPALSAFMRGNPDAAAVGPAIHYLSDPNVIWSAGGWIDRRRGRVTNDFADGPIESLPAKPFPVDHLSGCCMLLRATAIERAGLLDPRFFMYFEETEWCVRLTRDGATLWVLPEAHLWHDVQPGQHIASRSVAYYMTRNRLLFLKATRAPWTAWVYTLASQARTVVALFVRPRSLARSRGRMPMLWAFRDYLLGRYGRAQLNG
jgi:hypothetical protein